MFELNYIALYWLVLIYFFCLYSISKPFFELCNIPKNLYYNEKIIWNERMNPIIAIIYIGFIVIFSIPFLLHKTIIQSEILDGIAILLIITGNIMYFYYYLDIKIKSKTKIDSTNDTSHQKHDYLKSEIPLKTNDNMECDTNYEKTNISNPVISDIEKEKIENNVENIENNKYKELKPSSLKPEEIHKEVTDKEYIEANISQIYDFMNLIAPKSKMKFLKKAKNVRTSKRELLAIANIILQKQLEIIDRKKVAQLLNDYFELNDVKPFNHKDVERWLNSKKPEYYKTLLSIQSQ
jgi:hypothetical protein